MKNAVKWLNNHKVVVVVVVIGGAILFAHFHKKSGASSTGGGVRVVPRYVSGPQRYVVVPRYVTRYVPQPPRTTPGTITPTGQNPPGGGGPIGGHGHASSTFLPTIPARDHVQSTDALVGRNLVHSDAGNPPRLQGTLHMRQSRR